MPSRGQAPVWHGCACSPDTTQRVPGRVSRTPNYTREQLGVGDLCARSGGIRTKTTDACILASVLLGCILGVLAWWACPFKPSNPSWQYGGVVRSTGGGLWRLQWGYEDDEVRFLAFVHSGSTLPDELIRAAGALPAGHVSLSAPGHEPTGLPSGFNVFELIDGKFRQEQVPLTVEQARKYCRAKTDRYTIEGLKSFLKEP
jgi:hypothetical protein